MTTASVPPCPLCGALAILACDKRGLCVPCATRINRVVAKVQDCDLSDWPSGGVRRWGRMPPRRHDQLMRGEVRR